MKFARYDIARSYEWNYDHPPQPVDMSVPRMEGDWSLCGQALASPLAIAAGPLLNGRWVLYYASLGFDLLTYKTVRSRAWPCYPLPNLLPVRAQTTPEDGNFVAQDEMQGSWAISFGMPSKAPETWRADVRWTRDQLHPAQKLIVSVVATVQPGWSMQQVADDYAQCAIWAAESGADFVEVNLSCPNVETYDGQLYQHPNDALVVARTVKDAIGEVPLLAKVGFLPNDDNARQLLRAVAPHLDGVTMVNGLATRVVDDEGRSLFRGQPRGIGGQAIYPICLDQIRRCREIIADDGLDLQLVGCGGVSSAEHASEMLDLGARAVQLATAPMRDPRIGLKIRRELSKHG